MNNVIVRLSQISEDVIRLFKRWVLGPPGFLPQAGYGETAKGRVWSGNMGPRGRRTFRGTRGWGLDLGPQAQVWVLDVAGISATSATTTTTKIKTFAWLGKLYILPRKSGKIQMSSHIENNMTWNVICGHNHFGCQKNFFICTYVNTFSMTACLYTFCKEYVCAFSQMRSDCIWFYSLCYLTNWIPLYYKIFPYQWV